MSDSYGSGLTFGADSAAPGAAPDAPQAQGANPATAPEPSPMEQFGGALKGFGERVRDVLPIGPHYTPPDPQMSPLDQSADLIQQRVKRAGSVATNPLLQIFNPEAVAAAREFIPKATEQLQTIEGQRSRIQAGRAQAETLGLAPGETSDQATQDDRLQVAIGKAMKGDLRAFQGIQAVSPDHANAIAPQVYEKIGAHLEKARFAFDSLASMQNEGQYQAKLAELRQNGSIADLEAAGLKPPRSYDAFNADKGRESRTLREAHIGLESTRQRLEQRNTYQPMEEKEAKTYDGRLTTAYGDKVTNGTWSTNNASGTRGFINNGLATPDKLGQGGVLGNADQRKQLGEEMERALSKQDVEKYRAFNRTYKLATTDEKGNPIGDRKINTNPNVQQGVAEGLASMLRGGSGGANVGLLKIELAKRGWAQAAIDGLVSNYAGTVNTLFKNADRAYLSTETQKQIRDVMDVLKTYNDSNVDDRALQLAKRAGALGFDSSALGLGKNESLGAIGDAIEEGRQAQIARMKPNFQAIGGGDGVLQLGAQRTGAGSTQIPAGTGNVNQLPNDNGILTPVQQAGGGSAPARPGPPANDGGPGRPTDLGGERVPAPAPVSGQPLAPVQQPGGGTPSAPVAIAGRAITPPPGIPPGYLANAQRIESGKSRDPWTATTKNSSASGAFQFVDKTWEQYKPEGAPARAKDATPQQQTEAFAKLTAANAATLEARGVPVNNTSLYVAHNLGATGGAKLMDASPNEDARSVVGDKAASNNPLFFRGRPTVATVLQRYHDAMNTPPQGETRVATANAGVMNDGSEPGPKPRPSAGGASVRDAAVNAIPGVGAAKGLWGLLTSEQKTKAKELGIDELPAIGSTVGALGGMASPIPGGTIMGGAAGGAAGQALKDYIKGNDQNPTEIAKQGALGGVLGVGGLPRGLNMAVRAVGAGGVTGGAAAVEGANGADALDEGLKGAGLAAGGELFGRALGMVGHKVYSMFAPSAQKAVREAAGAYADAAKVLESEAPKLPGVGGAAGGLNPKYAAAETAKAKAETTLKDAGLNPEEAAYAHRVSSEGVPRQEAEAAKPGVLEEQRLGQGYQQIEKEVGDRGVGNVKPTPKLADGPMATAANEKMAPEMRRAAERTEMKITAPAANWQDKWVQLKEARTALLDLERDALSSTTAGRTQQGADYRRLADAVRTQQEKAANYVFGPKEGPAVMQRLKTLDTRYRNLMEATNGGKLEQAAGLKGEAGREADRAFKAFAANDPAALRAWAAMRKAGGGDPEKTIPWTVVLEGIPVVKHLKVGVLANMLRKAQLEQAAGSPAKFSDFIRESDGGAQATRDVTGQAGARAAVQ